MKSVFKSTPLHIVIAGVIYSARSRLSFRFRLWREGVPLE